MQLRKRLSINRWASRLEELIRHIQLKPIHSIHRQSKFLTLCYVQIKSGIEKCSRKIVNKNKIRSLVVFINCASLSIYKYVSACECQIKLLESHVNSKSTLCLERKIAIISSTEQRIAKQFIIRRKIHITLPTTMP